MHPDYNFRTIKNDIAIIQLNQKVTPNCKFWKSFIVDISWRVDVLNWSVIFFVTRFAGLGGLSCATRCVRRVQLACTRLRGRTTERARGSEHKQLLLSHCSPQLHSTGLGYVRPALLCSQGVQKFRRYCYASSDVCNVSSSQEEFFLIYYLEALRVLLKLVCSCQLGPIGSWQIDYIQK